MKIVMMGAGGVGGAFGARLLQAGNDVAFIARGAHLAALQDKGLSVVSDWPGVAVPALRVAATDDPASLGEVDYVLISVKLADSASAIRVIRPLMGDKTTVVSLQNGISKDELLWREFGRERVVGGVAYIGAFIDRPGVIRQISQSCGVALGEYSGAHSPRAVALAEAFKQAGVGARVSDDIRRTIWEKFVLLVGLSGATTAMRSSIGPICANARTRAFLLKLMQEVVALGLAEGVALPPDFANDRIEAMLGMSPDMDSSMHHDLKVGRPLEVNWLSGKVAELGEKHGVATPANAAVRDILALHAAPD